jgi:hypothetical protein
LLGFRDLGGRQSAMLGLPIAKESSQGLGAQACMLRE